MSKKRRRHQGMHGTVAPAPGAESVVAHPVGDLPAEARTADARFAGEPPAPERVAADTASGLPAAAAVVATAEREREPEPEAERAHSHESGEASASLHSGDLFPMPAGLRLRAAREARGLTREEVARTAHIPSAVLADIEADRMDQMAPIYARGYLRSFARVVGVPEVEVVGTNTAEHEVPPLVPSRTGSRSRHLAQRYGNLLAYAMLTLVVLVPIVMLGTRPTPPAARPTPTLAELDQIPVPNPAATGSTTSSVAASVREPDAAALVMGPPLAEPSATPVPVQSPVRPVMASMAPMPDSPAESTVSTNAPLAARKVVLRLEQSSWVELTGAEGRRIEYALLPAGTVREYQIAGNANLRIGNSRGATLSVDGRAVDLAAHSRSNVARVELGAVPASR